MLLDVTHTTCDHDTSGLNTFGLDTRGIGRWLAGQKVAFASALVFVLCGGISAVHAQSVHAQSPSVGKNGTDSQQLDVEVINKSTPTLCAEHDNVQIDFKSAGISKFQIQAKHPAYIANISKEAPGFDLTNCSFKADPVIAAKPRKKTFWESPKFWLTGYTFKGFWRPNDVPVRVGKTVEHGFHMVQLWMLYRERAEEIMVFYPPDGYWRARPLPFADMRWTAYGSSFIVGPVEVQKRPLVRLKEIVFAPTKRQFTLHFLRGGHATITLKSVDQNQISLDVGLSKDVPRNVPFASLRSMYVTETNSDVARLAWRSLSAKKWSERPVMELKKTLASYFWAGRRAPSQHNLSAPDFVFRKFQK